MIGQKRSPFMEGNIVAGFKALAHQLTPLRLAGNFTVRDSRHVCFLEGHAEALTKSILIWKFADMIHESS